MAKYRRYFVRPDDNSIFFVRARSLWDFYKCFSIGPFKTKTKAANYVQSKQGGGGNTQSV